MRTTSTPLAATVELGPEEFLAGWDAGASRLFVSALLDARAGAFAAVRIAIRGTGIAATLMGTVVAVRRAGTRALAPGVSLVLEDHSSSAANYLALVAQGRAVDFYERESRYAVKRRLTITHKKGGRFESMTLNVSESGCCVRWLGPAPAIGERLRIRPASAFLWATLDATVCWAGALGALADAAGLRVYAGGRAWRRWRSMVEQAARSGAPLL